MFDFCQKILKKPILFLFALTFLVYISSFWNKFVWDDEQFIYKNEYVKNIAIKEIFNSSTTSGAGINSNYYRPLTTLSFAIDYQFWGLNEFGFHLTNTFLHAMAGVFLYLFLREMRFGKKTSLLISTFFIIHPLQTEAVTYINSRGDSMYAFFALLGLWVFSISFRKRITSFKLYDRTINLSQHKLLFFSLCCYVLAILSKEIALASGGLFFLTLVKKLIESENIKSFLRENYKKVLMIFSMLFSAFAYLFFRVRILNFSSTFNFHQESNFYTENIGVRLLTFINSIWAYLRLAALPYPLHMERSTPIIANFNFGVISVFIFFIFMIGLGIFEIKKRSTNLILFGLGWFVVMMIPVSGIIPINGLFYEHWLYLPIVGFFLIVIGITRLFLKKINYLLVFGYACALIILTVRQNYFWNNPIRFYEYTLNYTQSARLYNNLGMAYADDNDFENAIDNYHKSLQIDSSYPQIFHNLGNVHLNIDEIDQAEKYFLQALERNNDFYYSLSPLINIYLFKNEYEKASFYLDKLLIFDPSNAQLLDLRNQITAKFLLL